MMEAQFAIDVVTTIDHSQLAQAAIDLGEVLFRNGGGDHGGNPCAGNSLTPFCNLLD